LQRDHQLTVRELLQTVVKTILTLARLALLEAMRTRTGLLALALLGIGAGLAWLIGQVAITETREIQAVLLASFLRFAAVFVIIIFVATAQARETADKGIDLLLSLPSPRGVYYLGKLLGYLACGWILAGVFGLFLLGVASTGNAIAWMISLAFELSIVAAATLFFVTTLTQVQAALAAVTGFYLLSRSMAAFQLISGSSLLDDKSRTHSFVQWLVDAIATILPRLDLFTQSAWLTEPSVSAGSLASIVTQAVIYVALLSTAGLIDLHRKNF
jgi:ABC-type transport system involved in multi-copper enzyme maturation permease subunit